MIESNDWPEGNYHASNVLYDSCDDETSDIKVGQITWWSAPRGATGDEAYFVVELGSEKTVDRVTLKNSRNGRLNQRQVI